MLHEQLALTQKWSNYFVPLAITRCPRAFSTIHCCGAHTFLLGPTTMCDGEKDFGVPRGGALRA